MTACVADPDDQPQPLPRPSDPGPVRAPDPPVLDLLREFSGCIQTPDLVDAGFGAAWSVIRSPAGTCAACHGGAPYAVIDADDAIATDQIAGSFEAISTFFTVAGDDVVVNADPFLTTSKRVAPFVEHPAYEFEAAPPESSLDDVYAAAHARWTTHTCEPPRF
jgi:hypothetical protein